jgi:hypothetical protein
MSPEHDNCRRREHSLEKLVFRLSRISGNSARCNLRDVFLPEKRMLINLRAQSFRLVILFFSILELLTRKLHYTNNRRVAFFHYLAREHNGMKAAIQAHLPQTLTSNRIHDLYGLDRPR